MVVNLSQGSTSSFRCQTSVAADMGTNMTSIFASTSVLPYVPARSAGKVSWATIAGKSETFSVQADTIMIDHVATVHPLFLLYKKISVEGHHIPVSMVALSVSRAISLDLVDAIQPMKNGWQIYTRTEEVRVELLAVGLDLNGKHVSLNVSHGEGLHSLVKLIIKDLPLHKVSNKHILAAVKEYGDVLSDVKYSNIWIDGKRTHLRNSDRFVYVSPVAVGKIPKQMFICTFQARVVKPPLYLTCFQCGQVGHKSSSEICPTLASEEIHSSIEAFRGGVNCLSNLYICPNDCTWKYKGETFSSAEQDYQYEKLYAHDKGKAADSLLQLESMMEIKHAAKAALPDNEVSEWWTTCEEDKMLDVCRQKFEACEYACEVLMNSKSELVEVTLDKR